MRFLSRSVPRSLLVLASISAAACGGGGGGTDTDDVLPGTYVDAVNGSNTTGDGTSAKPYKTIKRGLQGQPIGGIVRVRPGLYDVANGETFPIRPGFGVTIIGKEVVRGQFITIMGGGLWSGDLAGRLHATIIPNDGNVIAGLTIVNPDLAVDFGKNPCAVLLAQSGAEVRNCTISGSHRGLRFFDTVSNTLIKDCNVKSNAIGIFVETTGTNNRVEGCAVTSNNAGVMNFTGGADFGGGAWASAGGNGFANSASNDFIHFTGLNETIFAVNCFWNQPPPSLAVGLPPPVASTDVWVVGPGSVNTTGAAQFTSNDPFEPYPGGSGGVLSP